jgi:hypothetical protein
MHLAAGSLDFGFVKLEVEVEVLERVILDQPAGFAQRLELRQPLDSQTPPQRKAGSRQTKRALQIVVGQASLGCGLKITAGCEHPRYRGAPIGGILSLMPARTSATCRTFDLPTLPIEFSHHVEQAAEASSVFGNARRLRPRAQGKKGSGASD